MQTISFFTLNYLAIFTSPYDFDGLLLDYIAVLCCVLRSIYFAWTPTSYFTYVHGLHTNSTFLRTFLRMDNVYYVHAFRRDYYFIQLVSMHILRGRL
jgi:hypothetical protein